MSASSELPAGLLSSAVLPTVVTRLAPLFAADSDDPKAARDAALSTLMSYQPEAEAEIALAAEIISFTLHSLEALSRATGSDVSLNQLLRLRGSAVSLSREAHKAQRKLDQLQKARRMGAATPEQPRTDDTSIGTVKTSTVATPPPKLTWTQAYYQRQREKNLARRHQKAAYQADPASIVSAAASG